MRENDRLLVEADATVMSGFGRQNGMRMEQISETTRLPPIPQRQPQEVGPARCCFLSINPLTFRVGIQEQWGLALTPVLISSDITEGAIECRIGSLISLHVYGRYHRTLRIASGRTQMPALELSNSSPRGTNQQGSAASFSHTMGHFALPLSERMRNIVRAGFS